MCLQCVRLLPQSQQLKCRTRCLIIRSDSLVRFTKSLRLLVTSVVFATESCGTGEKDGSSIVEGLSPLTTKTLLHTLLRSKKKEE